MIAQDKVKANNLKRQRESISTTQHFGPAFCSNLLKKHIDYLIVIPDNFDSSMHKMKTINSVSHLNEIRDHLFYKEFT